MSILNSITSWWSSFYGNHQLVSVAVRFLHLAGLLMGAGTALYADRQVQRAAHPGSTDLEAVMTAIKTAHRRVLSWFLLIAATGVLMTASETSTFLASKVYWIKMTMIGVLLANGAAMLLAERRARRIGVQAGWSRMVVLATTSTVFWLIVLFLGALLTVAA